ncbi:hypothetical protein BBF96_05650 [Anoxybacter fermentans]|uniref:UvrD-like helicase C-terminal domain-containing protein n=1 Tax=Anoxybacter fermentans TaxID=1323375 RepID=A0A3S9SXD8_9FIRM|nr:PD-(D/E)XK nuclease family protein [Anoxybacter fermentans]AZR72920.1 hypothetical protein BBF96_05650 [Anoxybacter fermentans]
MPEILYGPMLSTGRDELIKLCAKLLNFRGTGFAYLVPTIQLKKEVENALINIKISNCNGQIGTAMQKLPIYLFDGFVNEVLKDWLVYQAPIPVYQQRLILKTVTNELLKSGQLSYLQGMVKYDGFYSSLLKWLKEVKKIGKRPEDWLTMYPISKKERELGYIYQKYEEFLDIYDLVDEERNYEILINRIQNSSNGSTGSFLDYLKLIVIDGFYKLNQLQLRLVKALIEQGKEVIVHTFKEEERSQLFLSSNDMIHQLQQLAHNEDWDWELKKLDELDFKSRTETLNHLCCNLFNLSAPKKEGDETVQILYTPDPYKEIEEIGRWIKRILLEDTENRLKLDDIAIILRNVSFYHFYIEEVFRELGIPYQISAGVELSRTPIFKLILKLYNIFFEDWSRESVVEILKSQYLQFGDEKTTELYEQLILEAGVIKGHNEWLKKLKLYRTYLRKEVSKGSENKEKLDLLTQLEEVLIDLFNRLSILAQPKSLLDHSQALLKFFAAYRLDQQITKICDQEILRRDLLSLDYLQQLLLDMIQFGLLLESYQNKDKKISAKEFISFLKQAADELHIPESDVEYDAVQILTPSQSRGRSFKHVFIGGLLEGDFPWYGEKDWLFKPEERKILKERGIYFKQFYEQLEEERLFFLEAVCTAKESLVLTCPTLETEESVQPSSFIQEVLNIFKERSIKENSILTNRFQGAESILKEALTRRELDEIFLRELWESDNVEEVFSFEELARLQDLYLRGEIVKFREGIEFSRYDGILEQDDIIKKLKKIYHPERVYSISQINDYALCPFQYYCKRILNLDKVEEPTLRLEPLDLGNLYHQILFLFFKDFPGFKEEPLDTALNRLKEVADEVMAKYQPGLNLPSGLWAIYREEVLENLSRMISYEYEEASKQNYQLKPTFLEASFGLKKDYQEKGTVNHPEPVIIHKDQDGEIVVKFSGKIDRIDITQDGKFLIIYDYKLGGRKGYDEIKEGIDLQLPIYIKAAQILCGQDKEVLGAGYFSLLRCERKSGIWRDIRKDLIPVTSRSKNCLTDEDWRTLLDKADQMIIEYITNIRSGYFPVNPAKECPDYCRFKKICRYEPSRIRRKKEFLRG